MPQAFHNSKPCPEQRRRIKTHNSKLSLIYLRVLCALENLFFKLAAAKRSLFKSTTAEGAFVDFIPRACEALYLRASKALLQNEPNFYFSKMTLSHFLKKTFAFFILPFALKNEPKTNPINVDNRYACALK